MCIRDSGQRALATGEQGQALDLLPRRPGLHLDARRQHVLWVGEDQPPLPAREEPREDPTEGRSGVEIGVGEDPLDPFVVRLDDVEQVALGAAEVLQRGREEGMPLLERGELFQSQRVDPAERGQGAFGAPEPLLLDLSLIHI